MMRRDRCIAALAAQRHRAPGGDAIIVATYQAAFDLMRVAPHPLNYLSIGAMGLASSHALGLAIGLPGRRVIVLDGDGSLLMNLGALVTIAGAGVPNLVHLVCENGCYEANGAHPLPSRPDFAAMARAAGIDAATFDDLAAFEAAIPGLMTRPGPLFGVLKIVPGDPSPQNYAEIHSEATRAAFRAALGVRPGRAPDGPFPSPRVPVPPP